jgi:hypothetical protein
MVSMAQTINIQRLWDQKYRDESVPFPIDGTATSVAGVQTATNIKDAPFSAKGDGVTDDTAAIQAAIDTATSGLGIVQDVHQVFAPPGVYVVSNLKIPAFCQFFGAGMDITHLIRKSGSTGAMIRDKAAAEGNASGATGITIRDITLAGMGGAGDGIDIGRTDRSPNPSAIDFNSYGGLHRVHVHDFPSGTGIQMQSNALMHSFLEVDACGTGITTSAGGGNTFLFPLAQINTTCDIHVVSSGDTFVGLQIEGGSTKPLWVEGGGNTFHGGYFLLTGNVTNLITVSAISNRFYGLHVDGQGHTLTNTIYATAPAQGTGALGDIAYWFDDPNGNGPGFQIDTLNTGRGVKYQSADISPITDGFCTIGANGKFFRVGAYNLQTQHLGASTPVGGASGDIKVANGKIWVNDAGTWKSVAIA